MEAGEVSTETIPRLIGHVEKVEKEDMDEEGEQIEGGAPAVEKEVGGGLTADREKEVGGGLTADREKEVGGGLMANREKEVGGGLMANRETTVAEREQGKQTIEQTEMDKLAKPTNSSRRKARSTLSVSRMKEEWRRARIKEQERRWAEATATGLGEIPAGELDLESAMISPDEGDKQASGKDKTDEEEGYGRIYTKTHEKRAERVTSRSERRKKEEERRRQEATQKKAQEEAERATQEEARRIIERAQLEEEEQAVQKRLDRKRKIQEMAEERAKDTEVGEGLEQVKVSATSKKQWKKQLGLKAKKRRRDED